MFDAISRHIESFDFAPFIDKENWAVLDGFPPNSFNGETTAICKIRILSILNTGQVRIAAQDGPNGEWNTRTMSVPDLVIAIYES